MCAEEGIRSLWTVRSNPIITRVEGVDSLGLKPSDLKDYLESSVADTIWPILLATLHDQGQSGFSFKSGILAVKQEWSGAIAEIKVLRPG